MKLILKSSNVLQTLVPLSVMIIYMGKDEFKFSSCLIQILTIYHMDVPAEMETH